MATIETGHTDVIHDAQLDYYAKQLATASSDHSIRIFINNVLSATLKDHTAPVWTLSWAHPTHSGLLASGAYDGTVCIWHPSNWSCIYKHKFHSQSVNSIQWGPLDAGCVLACASSDGTVSLLVGSVEGTWSSSSFNAHQVGVNAVAWLNSKKLVTGGCDNLVKIWSSNGSDKWVLDAELDGHTDWVRDVAVSNGIIATCSQDRSVLVWSFDSTLGVYKKVLVKEFGDVVWKLSWSPSGNVLAVSCGDNKVTCWKAGLDNVWVQVADVKA